MKLIQLSLKNDYDKCWITFEKEDNLPHILPLETDFQILTNVVCVVAGHYCLGEDSKFITSIKAGDIYPNLLEPFEKTLLKNGWKIIFQDDNLKPKYEPPKHI